MSKERMDRFHHPTAPKNGRSHLIYIFIQGEQPFLATESGKALIDINHKSCIILFYEFIKIFGVC